VAFAIFSFTARKKATVSNSFSILISGFISSKTLMVNVYLSRDILDAC
jgi:hypothetical protein